MMHFDVTNKLFEKHGAWFSIICLMCVSILAAKPETGRVEFS